ncbi:TerD family protein [Microbispora sp. GKU 823]|uniref:TerD family protein n=1 Tax=Microbispora sp. GKU 823 TaxID=1652100 RepID=UPI0021175088|nr:TerD family protein [Microbispora sp. GKU 823]
MAALTAVLTGEMLRRAAALPPVGTALLDEELDDLLAPEAERSASASLVRLPRGSVRPLPRGERIRLFLHWAEPSDRVVDLDLSVAVFDARWEFVGLCDYTNLRLGASAAVHSGDLTSAPEPLGASEFVDLDVAALRATGGRYVVPIVFSYNDVPFDELARGFAGFMDDPDGLFDPLAVRQRFDLTGPAKILVPLVADLWSRTMRWVDLNVSAFAGFHDVYEHEEQIARLGAAAEDAYGLGERVTLWEVACWHAAARAREVVVRHRDGAVSRHARRPGEDAAAFASRLGVRHAAGPAAEAGAAEAGLAVVLEDDVRVSEGAQVYALHPARLDPALIRSLDACDLVGMLAPAAR